MNKAALSSSIILVKSLLDCCTILLQVSFGLKKLTVALEQVAVMP